MCILAKNILVSAPYIPFSDVSERGESEPNLWYAAMDSMTFIPFGIGKVFKDSPDAVLIGVDSGNTSSFAAWR